MGKFYAKHDGSFLLSLDAAGAPGSGKGKKRQKKDAELTAEQQPRSQQRWNEEERRRSRLPKAGDPDAPSAGAPGGASAGDEDKVGRKKRKRLQVLAAKKSRAEQKKVAAVQQATEAARQALKGKATAGDGVVREAAAKLLEGCSGVAAEQRLLATVAERVAADPNQDLELFDVFFELHRRGGDAKTRQLALLSAVAIFRDLVPGYRIRAPTEQERPLQRSKEVLLLTKHEMELLTTYRRLLPALEAAMRREAIVFAPALAALVKAAFDFNYRQRLLGTAVTHCCSADAAVRRVLSEGMQEMFEADMRLEASREVVLAVGRLAQAAAGKAGKRRPAEGQDGAAGSARRALAPELLKALLHIPIGRAETAELRGDAGVDAEDDDVRKGLSEASISHNVHQLRRAETELLYEVFVVYLRILRQRHLHGRELMAAVLTGLGRWGQHVNLELLLEILAELRHTVEDALGQSDELVSLQGLRCALTLLSGPSQALQTDAGWIADAMAKALSLSLPSLHSTHSESPQWPPARCFSVEGRQLELQERELALALEAESVPALVLRCLEAALRCPQGYGKTSDAALAVLLEQLFLLAASADAHVGLAVLREAAQLLKRHHRLHVLLDAEGGLFGLGGVSDRAVSVLWHLQLLSASLLPELAQASREVPAAVRQRRTLIADLFPMKDAGMWLQAEFTRHIAGLSKAAVPRAPQASGRRAATFMSDKEVGSLQRV